MIPLGSPHRYATREDAPAMATFVDMAGEGLASYVWQKSARSDETCWDVGVERARRENGSFSYRNTILREANAIPTACLIGYPLPDVPEPVDYSDMPAMFVPLQELEDQVPGTWYVNVLATLPEARGLGYGRQLLDVAEQCARASQKAGLSLIVSDANIDARRLYERCGYQEAGVRKMIKENWQNPGVNWILLLKTLRTN